MIGHHHRNRNRNRHESSHLPLHLQPRLSITDPTPMTPIGRRTRSSSAAAHPIRPYTVTVVLAQLPLRILQAALGVRQLLLQRLDVIDGHLDGAGLAVALLLRRRAAGTGAAVAVPAASAAAARAVFVRVVVAVAVAVGVGVVVVGRRRRQQRGNLVEGVVDPVASALLGDLVRRPFGRQVGRERFGIRHAGEVGALEDVLVIRLGREEKGGRLGVDGCFDSNRG